MRSQRSGELALAFALAAGLGMRAQEAPGWELTGIVTYNSKPVHGASVYIEGGAGVKPATTDSQGRYTLKGLAPGAYRVHTDINEGAVESASRSVTVAAGSRLSVDLAIPKGAVLSGRVLDRDKRPVAGVFVHARYKTGDPIATRLGEADEDRTNDRGEYRIAHLTPGTYIVAVTPKPLDIRKKTTEAPSAGRTDYPLETFYPGVTELATAAALDLHSGEEHTSVDIALLKHASQCVSFRIAAGFLFSNEQRRPSTEVTLEPVFGPSIVGWGRSFENPLRSGEASSICGLVPGEYRLRFQNSYSEPVAGEPYVATLHMTGYLAVPFTIKDRDVDLGALSISAGQELRGSVSLKETSSKPLPAGIQVRLMSTEAMFTYLDDGGIARVEPGGSFQAARVFDSDYGVRVLGLPAGYYLVDALQQGRSVLKGGLRAGNGDLSVVLSAEGPSISGRVLTADGTPIPDVAIALMGDRELRPAIVHSDQNGAYGFVSGVGPGRYRIAALPGILPPQGAEALMRAAANGEVVELSPRESKVMDLHPD